MTVAELIEKLKKVTPETTVYHGDHEWGPLDISDVVPVAPSPEHFTKRIRPPGVVIW